MAGDADRYGAANRIGLVEAKTVARGGIERALQLDIGFASIAGLAVFDGRRRAGDLAAALELKTLGVGGGAQGGGVEPMTHDQMLGGEVFGIDRDGVIGRARR